MAKRDTRRMRDFIEFCASFTEPFTVQQMVARVIQERPDRIREFSKAWERLLETDRVVVCSKGRNPTYQLQPGLAKEWASPPLETVPDTSEPHSHENQTAPSQPEPVPAQASPTPQRLAHSLALAKDSADTLWRFCLFMLEEARRQPCCRAQADQAYDSAVAADAQVWRLEAMRLGLFPRPTEAQG